MFFVFFLLWLYSNNNNNMRCNSLLKMMMPKMNALKHSEDRNMKVDICVNGFSLNWKT